MKHRRKILPAVLHEDLRVHLAHHLELYTAMQATKFNKNIEYLFCSYYLSNMSFNSDRADERNCPNQKG